MIKKASAQDASVESAIQWLNRALPAVEELDQFCRAHEVIDLNCYKVFTNAGRVKKALLRKDKKSFEFIINKN